MLCLQCATAALFHSGTPVHPSELWSHPAAMKECLAQDGRCSRRAALVPCWYNWHQSAFQVSSRVGAALLALRQAPLACPPPFSLGIPFCWLIQQQCHCLLLCDLAPFVLPGHRCTDLALTVVGLRPQPSACSSRCTRNSWELPQSVELQHPGESAPMACRVPEQSPQAGKRLSSSAC